MEPLELRGDTCPDRSWHEGRGRPVVWAWTGWAPWQPGCLQALLLREGGSMQRGRVMSGEWKTFRNYFLKHNSSVSCFYDLELPWGAFRVSEPPGRREDHGRHCGWQPERWRSVPTALALGTAAPGAGAVQGSAAESDREVCGGPPPRSLAEAFKRSGA